MEDRRTFDDLDELREALENEGRIQSFGGIVVGDVDIVTYGSVSIKQVDE